MSTNHTPGPWAIIADVPGHEIGYRAIAAVEDGELAETICNPSPMGAANAALIAAAPDLLAALQALVEEYEPNIKTFALNAPRKARWERAIAAIAKATGG